MTTTPRAVDVDRGNPQPRSSVPWLLRRLNQRYRDAMATALAAGGFEDLPQRGYWALMALGSGASDASQLVSDMRITKQAVSKLVDILVTSDFVDRRTDVADRRRTALTLTAKGRRAVVAIERAVRATEQAFVAEIDVVSFDEFTRTLAKLAGEQGDATETNADPSRRPPSTGRQTENSTSVFKDII